MRDTQPFVLSMSFCNLSVFLLMISYVWCEKMENESSGFQPGVGAVMRSISEAGR